MNRRHEELKSEIRSGRARAGTTKVPSSADQTELVKRNLERFREIVKGTNKTALLWAAALTIVWLTGLERINHDVTDTFDAIQHSNWNKQRYLETKVKKDFESRQDLALRSSEETLANIEQALDQLKKRYDQAVKDREAIRLKSLQQPGDTAEKESLRYADAKVKMFQERINAWPLVRKARKKEFDHAKRVWEQNEKSIGDQTTSIEAQRENLRKELQELRAKKKGVSFDILTQKFEVLPLYAPIIWTLFLIGLIAYFLRARSSLLQLCIKTIGVLGTKSPSSSSNLKDIFSEAPWWLAPLPHSGRGVLSVEKVDDPPAAVGTGPVNQSPSHRTSPKPILSTQLLEAVGWQHGGLAAGLMSTSFLFVLVFGQMRVIWLGLEMSRQLGSNHQRTLVLLSLLSVALLTIFAVRRWFVQPTLSAADGPRGRAFSIFEAACAILLVLALSALSLLLWNRPKIVNVVRSVFEESLFWIAIAVMIGLVVSCGYQVIRFILNRSKERPKAEPGGMDRRQFLVAAIGSIGALGAIRALRVRNKPAHPMGAPRFIHSDKQCRKKRKSTPGLAHGFYLNSKSKIIHYISVGGVIGGLSDCGGFRVDKLKPFAGLSLPVRKPSGRNTWSIASPIDLDDALVTKPQPANRSKPETRPSRRNRRARVSTIPTASVGPGEQNPAAISPMNLLKVELKKDEIRRRATHMPIATDDRQHQAQVTRNPRVNLRNASFAFENAVLFILNSTDLRTIDYEAACRLMVYAINHDLRLSADTGQLPSFRLYDLLAGVALRYDRSEYSAELLRLIKEFGLETLFQPRIKKWGDPNSSWHRRWNNLERPTRWGGKQGVSLEPRRYFR